MPRVVFVHADGRREQYRARVGETVMDCAFDNRVAGIIAQCGGACICATCHCFVAPPWLAKLPPLDADEDELLGYLSTRRATSRLSCQIRLTEALDGIEVEIPERQV